MNGAVRTRAAGREHVTGQPLLLGTADLERPLPWAALCDAEWEDDIAKLCSAMPFMTGCSFWVQCTVSL